MFDSSMNYCTLWKHHCSVFWLLAIADTSESWQKPTSELKFSFVLLLYQYHFLSVALATSVLITMLLKPVLKRCDRTHANVGKQCWKENRNQKVFLLGFHHRELPCFFLSIYFTISA